jgi:exopolysaccharide biosynthesis polyprenyl glycosylphosphotransferase
MNVVDGHHLFEQETGRLSIDLVRPSTIIFSTGFRHRLLSKALKRLADIVVSGSGLLLLLPLYAIIAILIKLNSPGPVFYRQTRVGLKGRPYRMWKFRTMRDGAEEDGSAQWASPDDPRVTTIGKWLRRLRIDEVPQFINVLKGEMSLVGPRPERPAFVQNLRDFIPYYDLRHTVRPGITGWAQIRFRYGASTEDAHMKLQYDLYYVKNVSLILDCRILLGTIRVVVVGAGAR